MPVYVDEPKTWNPKYPNYCHMYADTLDELFKMSDKLSLKRAWFQGNASYPHFDLSLHKRLECASERKS